MTHPKFNFISMEDKPCPPISDELRQFCIKNLASIDEELLTGHNGGEPGAKEIWRECKRRKWEFAESLQDESAYRYACYWIQNQ